MTPADRRRRWPPGCPVWTLGLLLACSATACSRPLTEAQRELVAEAIAAGRRDDAASQLRSAAIYQQLREQGLTSPDLLLNQGNAYRRGEQPGRAVACYRSALRWNPRDERVRANLERLLTVQGVAEPQSIWRMAASQAAPSRWLGIGERIAAGALLLLAAAAAAWLRLARRSGSWRLTSGLVLLAGLLLASGGAEYQDMRGRRGVVVVSADAVLRAGPADGFAASEAGGLSAGRAARVIETDGEWVLVETDDGRRGWTRRRDVVAY